MTVSDIVNKLESMNDRKSGIDYLNKCNLTKISLVKICKYLDIQQVLLIL